MGKTITEILNLHTDMRTKKIAIIGAMDEEIQALTEELKNKIETPWAFTTIYEGILFGRDVIIAKCGVGKVLSAILTQHLIDTYNIDQIICTGVAGSLNNNFNIGDVILSQDLIQHDMDATAVGFERGLIPFTDHKVLMASSILLEKAKSFTSPEFKSLPGRILSGDVFVTHNYHHRNALTDELQGDACEMEGASIALVCTVHKVPFIVIRSISDKADGTSHMDFWEFVKIAAKRSHALVEHILRS